MADPAPTPTPESTSTIPEASSTSETTPKPETTDAAQPLLAEEAPATDAAKDEPAESVPDKYEAFKVPDGYQLDEASLTKASDLFKELKLTQSQAQKLIDMYGEVSQDASEAPYKEFNRLTKQWYDESMNHPDLKGKLGQGKEVSVSISKMLNDFGDPQLVKDFRSVMDLTGAGNHPAFIRVLAKAAAKLTEGGHVAGTGPAAQGQNAGGRATQPTAAQAMWPTLPSQNR